MNKVLQNKSNHKNKVNKINKYKIRITLKKPPIRINLMRINKNKHNKIQK